MLRTAVFPYRVDHEIVLQPLHERYARTLFALVDSNRHYLRRWQNWPDRIQDVKDMRALIRHSVNKAVYQEGIDTMICYRGRPVGKIGLVHIDWGRRQAEIGYWLIEAIQGRGVMTRSCHALVDYALNQLGLHQVDIRCAVGNARSQAIPQRLGFRCEGLLPIKVWLHGIMENEVLYTMTQDLWRKQMIYHITTRAEWDAAQRTGVYRAASLDTQGFIHLSGKEQVVRVANVVFRDQSGLMLLCVDPTKLTAELKYEPPDPNIPAHHYDGELFPHLYGVIPLDAVVQAVDFVPNHSGLFEMPVVG